MPRLPRRALLLLITLTVFAFLFSRMDFANASAVLRRADPALVTAAFALSLTFPLLCALRWRLIVRRLGARLGLWPSFIIIMAAWPLGAITPAKSGDLIKIVFLKDVLSCSRTTGVILAERVMDVVALCLFGVLGGVMYGFPTAVLVAGAILGGVLLFFLAAASPLVHRVPEKWRTLVLDVLAASREMYMHAGAFGLILFITLLNWFFTFWQTWIVYRAFQVEVPLLYIIAALPIAIFAGLAPITLAGMGTRDSAMILLFQTYASLETNLAAGILYSILGYWFLALLGLPFLRHALLGRAGAIHGESLRQALASPPAPPPPLR
ncbi:MAG: YbhN family protein [bacterium]